MQALYQMLSIFMNKRYNVTYYIRVITNDNSMNTNAN